MAPAKSQQVRASLDSGYQSRQTTPRTSDQEIRSEDGPEQGNVDNIPDLNQQLGAKNKLPDASADFNIFESIEPPVTSLRKLRFYGWCAAVAAGQCAKDVKDLQIPSVISTPFMRDLVSHFVMVPMANKEPRLLASGPGEHIEVYRPADVAAYQKGQLKSLQGQPTQKLINLASNNYGGFAQLEPGALELQQHALQKLPMTPAPPALEEALRDEFKKFMDFDACEITSSGFSCNMLAFKTAVDVATAQNRPCIWLCDRESHSSMWTGAYASKATATLKFNHSCVTNLDAQLRHIQRTWPTALVCVAIEGTYSMEGSVPPLPAILALKKTYGFALLVDEAHSFLGLGSGGRGSFEYWQDQGFACPLSEADFLTCTFSKSVGCLGGAVLANGEFGRFLKPERDAVEGPCGKGIATGVMVRVLQLLRKPMLIRYRMALLKKKSFYVAKRLSSAGCKILGSPGSPNVCFPVGTMQSLSECIKDSIEAGVALSCGVPPATTLWCCRVRASIFATMSWEDIDTALVKISRIGFEHDLSGIHTIGPNPDMTAVKESAQCGNKEAAAIEAEAARVDREIEALISNCAQTINNRAATDGGASGLGRHQDVLDVGVAALRRYGVGPCSARHYYGSFDTHVELEKKLAHLYPCLTRQAGECQALVCGDAQIALGAAVAARAQVPRKKNAYTLVLVPRSSPSYIFEELAAVKKSWRCVMESYDSTRDLVRIIEAQYQSRKGVGKYQRCYLTLLVRSGVEDELDLPVLLKAIESQRKRKVLLGSTVLLDDTRGLGRLGPRRLGYLDQLEATYGEGVLAEATPSFAGSRACQIVLMGSWYEAFGHVGGYMIGSKMTMDSFNFQNRGFIFSAPPLPLQTVMTAKALGLLETRSGVDP